MFFVFLDGIVAEQGETRLAHISTTNLVIECDQKLFDRCRTVESDHL